MTSIWLSIILRPVAALLVMGLILLPARRAVQRMPEGRVRRLLLLRISGTYDTRGDEPQPRVSQT
jgi:hypothetical protein